MLSSSAAFVAALDEPRIPSPPIALWIAGLAAFVALAGAWVARRTRSAVESGLKPKGTIVVGALPRRRDEPRKGTVSPASTSSS